MQFTTTARMWQALISAFCSITCWIGEEWVDQIGTIHIENTYTINGNTSDHIHCWHSRVFNTIGRCWNAGVVCNVTQQFANICSIDRWLNGWVNTHVRIEVYFEVNVQFDDSCCQRYQWTSSWQTIRLNPNTNCWTIDACESQFLLIGTNSIDHLTRTRDIAELWACDVDTCCHSNISDGSVCECSSELGSQLKTVIIGIICDCWCSCNATQEQSSIN